MASLSFGGAAFESASIPPELEPEALAGAGLQSSGSAPVSWGRTQRGQTWRQAMFRRGLPAALLATLALGGAYWMLRVRTGPAAKLPAGSTDVNPSEPERSAGARLAPPEAAEEPVVRALKPAPQAEVAPAAEQPSPELSRVAEARVAPPSIERGKAPASAPKAVKPSAAVGAAKAPAAPRVDNTAAGSSSEPGDAKTTRPNFLNKLEGQDYGGRE